MKRIIFFVALSASTFWRVASAAVEGSIEDLLEMGDNNLISDDPLTAIKYYEQGIKAMNKEVDSLITGLSLYTNSGTAYSSSGDERKAVEMYRQAILLYSNNIDEIVEKSVKKEASELAAQASFFLAMTFQELDMNQKAVDAYAFANTLDPNHWASLANMGSVLQDNMKQSAEALAVYNKAYDILTQKGAEPTDPPEHPEYVLSQLQYRIGLAISYADKQKCVMHDDPTKEVPCSEMAASAFNYAIELDPNNENAKHMLASVTADATMRRASNTYVTQLFEDYAENFEHSLVQELGYDGYQRLRRGFNRAFGGEEKVPKFKLVVDAGCGTGLVGEQFRNVSDHLVGADLSSSIINEALKARPNLYDETIVGDVTDVFKKLKPIDLIIAGDSYIYFGDLNPLFESMNEGLADGGFASFTLENPAKEYEENLSTSKPDWRWQLQPSGRFAHSKDYVISVGTDNSLRTIHYEAMDGFRKEGKNDVRGHIFIMQKHSSTAKEL
mmetsp:Transcript_8990/g.11320  ORF Transcript_8990/g.11320 Transcript_8990/m.11320 type:complete len:499 (+) Transcript_8990:77-1573(+)